MSQLTPEEKERQLDILPKLVKTICPDCKFWACILQRRVITSDQQEVLVGSISFPNIVYCEDGLFFV